MLEDGGGGGRGRERRDLKKLFNIIQLIQAWWKEVMGVSIVSIPWIEFQPIKRNF